MLFKFEITQFSIYILSTFLFIICFYHFKNLLNYFIIFMELSINCYLKILFIQGLDSLISF